MGLRAGERLGPYEVEAILGRGGMGTVYRAHLVEPRHGLAEGAPVALKVFHAALLDSAVFRERLEREARLGVRVTHPNVVRAFGEEELGDTEPPKRVLVMEYVEGQTLRDLLREVGRVPEALARTIARALARGLVAIHAAGAVHRDLKPENVLITPANEVKIMDLGVAHLQDAALRLTHAESFAGSIDYAAPEQFPGVEGPPDGRSDLFALGILLYEMVVGTHPFAGESTRQVLHAILHEHPPKAGEVNPQVSPFLEEVIETLLAKRPDARFASARELLDVLVEGEASAWWTERAYSLRRAMGGRLRRVRVPHETPVVGREPELASLREAFEKARSGAGQVVLLRGEAGIGKTRLAEEFVRRLVQDGQAIDFLAGAYPPGGVATVHGGFSTAFRERLGEQGVRDALAALCSPDWYLLPALAALLDGEPRPEGVAPFSRASLCTAFASVTRALAEKDPVVLLIDDLHHAPDVGRVLFSDLAAAIASQRVLLIGCGRRRLPASWVAEVVALPHARQLELERLGPKDLHRLLLSALGAPRIVRDLEPTVTLKSEGNPYFVFEILRSLSDQGRIRRTTDGTWTAVGRTDVMAVPSSVHDLIQARLAGLADEERELLDVGACCGFAFDPLVVAEVAGMDRIPALRALARIEANHRLVRARGRDFAFDHHQVMEVLYAGLAPMLREEYHAAIAEALTRRLDEDGATSAPGALAAEICRHGLRSSRPELAKPRLAAALDHLQEEYQLAEAAELLEEALGRAGLATAERRFQLLLRQNRLLDLLGNREAQEASLQEAQALADELDQDAMRAEVNHQKAHCAFNQGKLDEARRYFEQSRVEAVAAGNAEREALAEGGLGLVAYRSGRLEDAQHHFERERAISEEAGKEASAMSALGNLGVVLLGLGMNEPALECLEQVMSRAKERGDLRMVGKCSDNLGILLQGMGRMDEAKRHYARAVEIADRVGDRMAQAVGRVNLGSLLREEDHLTEARELLTTALEIGIEIRDPVNQGICLDNLGAVALALGEHDVARDRFDRALALFRQVGSKRDAAYVLANQGRLAEDEGRLEDAIRLVEESIRVRHEMRYRGGEAESLTLLGRLLATQGETQAAAKAIEDALRILDDHEVSTARLRALTVRATLDGETAEALRDALGNLAGKVEREDEIRARWALWKATGDETARDEARRLLEARITRAPPASQEAMRSRVPLHREILAGAKPA